MKKWIPIFLGVLWTITAIGSTEVEKTKQIKKVFAADKHSSVELVNKYGSIHINTWEKDSVAIEVSIKTMAKTEEEAKELIDMARIELIGKLGFISAKTYWGENSGLIKKSAMDIKRYVTGEQKITIDYTVYMPKTNKLSIENTFGDVYMPSLEGDVRLDLSHGDLKAKAFKTVKSFKLEYGKAYIDSLEEGNFEILFGDLILEKINELYLNSKVSEIEIGSVETLHLDSKSDKFFIGEIGLLKGNTLLTNIKIEKLKIGTDLTSKYGSVSIKKVMPKFKGLHFGGDFTDYTLYFNDKASFSFNFSLQSVKDFSYSKEKVEVLKDSTDNKMQLLEGNFGKPPHPSTVVMRAKGGYLKIH